MCGQGLLWWPPSALGACFVCQGCLLHKAFAPLSQDVSEELLLKPPEVVSRDLWLQASLALASVNSCWAVIEEMLDTLLAMTVNWKMFCSKPCVDICCIL